MNDDNPAAQRDRIVQSLRQLVDALDRRVAHVERLGEDCILRQAAALRKTAVTRIKELMPPLDPDIPEARRSDDVMADDGGPLPVLAGSDSGVQTN
jgi:hypothetical protein